MNHDWRCSKHKWSFCWKRLRRLSDITYLSNLLHVCLVWFSSNILMRLWTVCHWEHQQCVGQIEIVYMQGVVLMVQNTPEKINIVYNHRTSTVFCISYVQALTWPYHACPCTQWLTNCRQWCTFIRSWYIVCSIPHPPSFRKTIEFCVHVVQDIIFFMLKHTCTLPKRDGQCRAPSCIRVQPLQTKTTHNKHKSAVHVCDWPSWLLLLTR